LGALGTARDTGVNSQSPFKRRRKSAATAGGAGEGEGDGEEDEEDDDGDLLTSYPVVVKDKTQLDLSGHRLATADFLR
jgi:hypothetical protein